MTIPSGNRSMIARRLDAPVVRGSSVSVIIPGPALGWSSGYSTACGKSPPQRANSCSSNATGGPNWLSLPVSKRWSGTPSTEVEGLLSKYILTLYVTGTSPRTKIAIDNLNRICGQELDGRYELEIVDVLENPQRAEDEKILATPTLIKQLPPPLRRVIGDLSDKEKVLLGLEVRPALSSSPSTARPEGS
jgi:circadian clock protein KaiB